MTEHKVRTLKYQMENLLNRMTANAYEYGVYIKDGEAFGELLTDAIQLIEDYQALAASKHAHPPDKSKKECALNYENDSPEQNVSHEKNKRKENENMDKLNLSAPWITFVHELEALFEYDPSVTIDYDKEENHVKLYVEGATKTDALTELLPVEKRFGNVVLKISVIPANFAIDKVSLIEKALDGGGILEEVIEAQRPGGSFKYLMFDREVAQFYNDQLDDPVGNKTMLYADIAKDIFGDLDGAFYCTEPKH